MADILTAETVKRIAECFPVSHTVDIRRLADSHEALRAEVARLTAIERMLNNLIADIKEALGEPYQQAVDEAEGDISVNTAMKIAVKQLRRDYGTDRDKAFQLALDDLNAATDALAALPDTPAPTCQTCRYWGNEPVKTEPVYDDDGRLKGQRLVESQPWWVARCDRGVSTKHSEGVPASFGCTLHTPTPPTEDR